jgi:predicted transcriptional regulator
MKTCCTCKEAKNISLFGTLKSSLDGHHWQCKICKQIVNKKYSHTNKGKIARRKAVSKYFKSENGHNIILTARRKEKRKLNEKDYRIINKEKINELIKNRYKNNPLTKLSYTVRIRTRQIFKYKGLNKKLKFSEYIGCSISELKKHIENQFQPGMNWNNHSRYGWHIDHKIPLSSAKTEEEIYKLCHYTNLQPLWAFDNLSKGDKV